jgi:hypothetical protein
MAHRTRRNTLKRKAQKRIKFLISSIKEADEITKKIAEGHYEDPQGYSCHSTYVFGESEARYKIRCIIDQCRFLYECTNMSFKDYIKAYALAKHKIPTRSIKHKRDWDVKCYKDLYYLF